MKQAYTSFLTQQGSHKTKRQRGETTWKRFYFCCLFLADCTSDQETAVPTEENETEATEETSEEAEKVRQGLLDQLEEWKSDIETARAAQGYLEEEDYVSIKCISFPGQGR